MAFGNICKILLICASITYVSKLAYKIYYDRTKKQARNARKQSIHDVIMFSYGLPALKKSKYSRCMITESIERLLYYLNSPRYTLDICIYVMTNLDMVNVILKLHYRGVKIRIIIDADMAFSQGSGSRRLEKQGIPVRWMKCTNLMHHKFCLIDASTDNPDALPVVLSGSLNWTNQALFGNWENVVVTSQEQIVKKYKDEFERLWIKFKPIVNIP